MKLRTILENVFTIDRFWTDQECQDFKVKSEKIGYEAATVDTEKGAKVVETVRNNNRVVYTDSDLARKLWARLGPYAPQQIGNSFAIGLNEMFRFYKYQSGQQFKKHIDQSYIRNNLEASYYTFMIYLNDHYSGGETTFTKATIELRQGMALIFLHNLEHERSEVAEGTKYVLRTDVMYRLDSSYLKANNFR